MQTRLNIHKLYTMSTGVESPDLPQAASVRYAVWKDAVNHFLKTGDRNAAISYLNTRFNRFADNRFDLIDRLHYLKELNNCIDDYIGLQLTSCIRKENFEFGIGEEVNVYGQIPRIDKHEDSGIYYIVFYQRETKEWKPDIKYKLIQSYCANEILKTDLSKVYIGVYDLQLNKHDLVCFTEDEVKQAWKDAACVASKFADLKKNSATKTSLKQEMLQN